ncbi:MAG: L-threonine 3-dehydrogenase [Pleomorphochaeta sp.]
MKRILITGALGQLGSEIAIALRSKYSNENVILVDIRDDVNVDLIKQGPFYIADCRDKEKVSEIVEKHNVDTIIHLAAILSARGESNPTFAWDININGLTTILEVAKDYGCSLFTPSSIGAFGPTTPKDNTPQVTIQRPCTIYGVSKVAGELLCDYYNCKYNVDTRGVRFPGLISYLTPPGGGTTDYAIEIFYEAIKNKKYVCPIKSDTYMDMLYMSDAVQAVIDLMNADESKLKHRNAYNITAMSFTPSQIAAEIKKHIPDFEITYDIDPIKQQIADSWPNKLDDSEARAQWGFNPSYDLEKMVKEMLEKISGRVKHDKAS